VSVLTTTPLTSAPSAGPGLTLPTGGAAWVFGAWVEVLASTAAPIAIAGVQVASGGSSLWWELDLGVGAGGAEVSVGSLRLFFHASGNLSTPNGLLLPVPLGGIGSGVRVAMRMRSSSASGGGVGAVTLLYYESLSSDQQTTTTQQLTSAPAGSATVPSLTPSATPWANSAWVEVIASAATDLGLLGLTHAGNADGFSGLEYDLGVGAASAETVITTLREGFLQHRFYVSWLPGIYPVAAGTRVAVRMRKAGTATTAHPVALLYYTNVSAAVTARVQPIVWLPV